MATVAAPGSSVAPAIRARGRFYFHLSLVCLAVGVLGFAPTYWVQVPLGTFNGTPLVHVHGIVFTGWLLLLVGQNWRIAQGRLDHHRAWGLAGVSLATMMLLVGLATAIAGLDHRIDAGYAEAGRSFLIVPFASITLFFAFFVAAVANIRRPEWHKRFIFVATSIALVPAVARMFQLANFGWSLGMRPAMRPPPPVTASLGPIVVCSLIIVIGMVHDWRTRGKIHPAWTIGLAITLVVAVSRLPFSQTEAWHAFADWTTRLT
jgi:hypothetical protein